MALGDFDNSSTKLLTVERHAVATVIRLQGAEPANTLTSARVQQLTEAVSALGADPAPLILTGNDRFFSAGADLNEVSQLTGSAAYEFASMGQRLMRTVENFPAPTIAAIQGFAMGGGLDLALACRFRIASPTAVFGHRGAALGIITGWGGTQRLPRLVGKARALQMFLCADRVSAGKALEYGLVDQIAEDPVAAAVALLRSVAH